VPEEIPTVFVALDRGSPEEDLALARRLAEGVADAGYGFKVNLDTALHLEPGAPGPYDRLAEFAALERPLFWDLKMWNGGRTMAAIAAGLARHPEHLVDAYPHAGVDFLRQVATALDGSETRLLGLTVLTHYSEEDAQALYGRSLEEAVRMLAARAAEAGCHGVVCPGRFAGIARDLGLAPLCPGIRPGWFADKGANAQTQVATPSEAIANGAAYLVVGSPITRDDDPVAALGRVLAEVREAAGS
jgi:orotidine-5'-phosphate decarboxylase